MPHKDDAAHLDDMIDRAVRAMDYTAGMTRERFASDLRTQDAVIRSLEVIGEACKRLSPETLATEPDTPWPQVKGMRDRLIHGYDDIDLDIVWDTLTVNLPAMLPVLRRMRAATSAG